VTPTTAPTATPTTELATGPTTGPPATTATTTPADNPATPPASNLPPVTVTNNTGRSDAVHLYLLGVNLTTGKLGYVNAAGTFSEWTGGRPTPVPAPDVSIPGPADGASTTIRMPKNLSGRLYMSFGSKLDFRAQPGFERTVHTRADGTVLRVLAPGSSARHTWTRTSPRPGTRTPAGL
jgi:hypothetical protein